MPTAKFLSNSVWLELTFWCVVFRRQQFVFLVPEFENQCNVDFAVWHDGELRKNNIYLKIKGSGRKEMKKKGWETRKVLVIQKWKTFEINFSNKNSIQKREFWEDSHQISVVPFTGMKPSDRLSEKEISQSKSTKSFFPRLLTCWSTGIFFTFPSPSAFFLILLPPFIFLLFLLSLLLNLCHPNNISPRPFHYFGLSKLL